GDTRTLERLAVLTIQAGQTAEAEQIRLRKAEIDRAHDRFRKIILFDSLSGHIAELAKLWTTLGRHFDAQGWSIVDEANLPAARPLARAHSDSNNTLVLPPGLAERAAALSAPFALDFERESRASAPSLGDCLADLRAAGGSHDERRSPSEATPAVARPGR